MTPRRPYKKEHHREITWGPQRFNRDEKHIHMAPFGYGSENLRN